ncbi:probable LON peptidase N-terminal domain and RING finger protein 1 at N-terminal half [Coccomyxa sp. Obi]|nr:probable LON peptidase N-terminal domain and RING finger protein 1 at N-terminal half [Coccomyxa sp. Obi]
MPNGVDLNDEGTRTKAVISMAGKPRGGVRAAPAPKMSERSQRALARAEASQRGTHEDAHAKGKRTATQCRDGEGSHKITKKSRRECAVDKQIQTDATTDAALQPDTSHYECPICMDLLIAPVVSPCGHDFCQHCYEGIMTTAGSRVICHIKCPICREPLPDRLPGVCKRLENTIEQLFPQQLAARRAILADELEERAKDRERAAQAQRAQRGESIAFAEVLETIHQLSQAAREGMGGPSYGPGGEGAEDAAQRAARQPWSSFDWSGYMPVPAPRPNMGERVRSLFTRGGQPPAARAQPPPQPPGAAVAAPAGPGTPGAGGHTLRSAPGDTTLWRRSVGVATRGMRALGRSSQAPIPRSAAHREGLTSSEEDSSSDEPPSGGMPGNTARDTDMGNANARSNPFPGPPFAFGSMPHVTVGPFGMYAPFPQGPRLVAQLPSGPHRWEEASRRFIPMSQPTSSGAQQASGPRIPAQAYPFPVTMVPMPLQQYRRLSSFQGGASGPSTTVEPPAQPLPQPQVPSSTVQLLVQASAGASALAGQQPSPVSQGASVAGPTAFIPMNQQLVNGSFLVGGGTTPLPMPAGTGAAGEALSALPSFPTFTMGQIETRSGRRRRRRLPPPRRRSANN